MGKDLWPLILTPFVHQLALIIIMVLSVNYFSTEQVNLIQQLFSYCLIIGTQVDIVDIIYSDLITKLLNKSRLKYVSYHRFISCSLQVLLGNIHPKLTEGSKQSHSIYSGTVPDPQDLERNIQLASTGLPFTLDEGTYKSQPLPESTTIDPKDSVGNKQPIDTGLTFTAFDEGTAKTTPRPKGSLREKDSRENNPPADMEPVNPIVADPSGTGAKYPLDTQPLVLSTYADVRAFLLSNDEAQETSDTESSCDDILKKYDNTCPLTECQLVKYLRKVSTVLFDRITEDNWEKHKEVAVNYVNLKESINEYYDENIAHRDQTDKLVEASMSSLYKSSTTIRNLYKGLNVITELLKEINNAVKDDPVINNKISEATELFTKISTNITEVLSLVKGFNFSDL
ncbi:hypothetical protein Tco_0416937 [Tanacetum coccineum]